MKELIFVIQAKPSNSYLTTKDPMNQTGYAQRYFSFFSTDEKKKYATLVIDNSGAWEETEKQVITAWEKTVK